MVEERQFSRSKVAQGLRCRAAVDPRNALALYARGLTLLKKGDTEAGKNEIDAAKAINPDVGGRFDRSESP